MSASLLPKKQRFTLEYARARIEALESRVAVLEKLVQVLQPPVPPNPATPVCPPPSPDPWPWYRPPVWCRVSPDRFLTSRLDVDTNS